MPLDFAYAVHSDVGDTCIGVKINGELRPLRTPLLNGDVIEVVRGSKPAACMPDWQSLTVSARARSAIRRHIRQVEKDEYVRLGRAFPGSDIRAGRQIADPTSRCGPRSTDSRPRPAKRNCSRPSVEAGFSPPRCWKRCSQGLKAAERAAAVAEPRRIENGKAARFYVRGDGLAPGVANCISRIAAIRCRVTAIVGIASQPQTLEVHVIDCGAPGRVRGSGGSVEGPALDGRGRARHGVGGSACSATIHDGPGVLGQACTVIGEASGNIVGVNMRHRHTNFFDVDFDVEVRDARHLTHIAAALRACQSVETVERARG